MIAAHFIRTHLDDLAGAITDRHFAVHAKPLNRQRCLEDARFHLQYLATALDADSPAMFVDYIGWTKVVLAKRNITQDDLAKNLEIMVTVLPDHPDAIDYLRAAIEQLPALPEDVPSFLDPRAPMWSVASEYLRALLRGSRLDATLVITNALDGGATLRDVYRQVFEPAQQEIGRLWQLNQITVAQEHFCTAATQHIMTQLYSRIFTGTGPKKELRAVAMCVGRELHEVGLRIITDLLELDGWQTWYLGASVPPAAAVQLCVDQRADFLLVSATLPPHIAEVRELVKLFHARPELAQSRVVVGGRAFRMASEVWRTIGADGFASNADDCIALLNRLASA
jgi:methanogenic corrinoid protein MtbC1